MALTDDMLGEVRLHVACGFSNRESLFWHMLEIEGVEQELHEELREAIEVAFVDHAEAARSWPDVTDCDRLGAAFASLAPHGVLTGENCGLTQQEGVSELADLSVTRDAIGDRAWDGYCFFQAQDLIRAAEGEGLMLAFGTFRNDETHADVVAQRVVAALEERGLEVAWNGSTDERINMPTFCWQRRQVATTEADISAFIEDWKLEVRAGESVISDFDAVLSERAYERFQPFANFGPVLLARLVREGAAIVERERAVEASWTDATTNDRIKGAFAELRERGICAVEHAGTTIQDGWGYAAQHATDDPRGAVFYHRGDVIDAIEGHELLLAFGAIASSPREDDDATAAIASETVAVLQAHGVDSEWSGSIHERIVVAPFSWRRRRWTEAPNYEHAAVAPQKTKATSLKSLLSRAFAAKHAKPAAIAADLRDAARRMAVVVKAVRDESGFHRQRLREMRQAWKRLDDTTRMHEGHAGSALVFTRTGEHHALLPRPALANLRDGRLAIFERASG